MYRELVPDTCDSYNTFVFDTLPGTLRLRWQSYCS